jgi:type I restriction enzyme S subunit
MWVDLVEETQDHISEEAVRQSATNIAGEDSLLVVIRSGILARRFPVAMAATRLAYNQDIKALLPDRTAIDPWFLFYVLRATEQEVLTHGVKKGATVHSIKSGFLEALQVPLPPLPEQRRLAARLREQLAKVTKARAALQAQLDTAQGVPAAVLRAVFNSPASSQWPRRNLSHLCTIVASQVDPRLPEFGCLPHVSGENIESGLCSLVNVRSVAEDGMISGKYLFEKGDVLYSKLRPYLRKVAIAESRGLCSADMYPLRMVPNLMDARFAAWMLLNEDFTNYAIEESQRSRMPKLNREQLFAWDAPTPPIPQQRQIAANIESQVAAARTLSVCLRLRLAALDHLPAALLRDAFAATL